MLRSIWLLAALVVGCSRAPAYPTASNPPGAPASPVVVLVSADAEWAIVRAHYPEARYQTSPWGEYFLTAFSVSGAARDVVFLHGGWGKIAAAASAQYAIDRWHPACLVNLGTCGGFSGSVDRHEILLAERTIVYDIQEAMGDSVDAIREYSTDIDLGWLTGPVPGPVRRSLLVSGDRDLVPREIPVLRAKYQAVAGDWESGAIAHTCARNRQRVLILRGVSDLVGETTGGEAYGNVAVFEAGARVVMDRLLADLPKWLAVIPREAGSRPGRGE